ncbi:Ig-like domain-containing protein [Xylanimonas allomyrinae]|uniref:Ig-like domain-containing protein n=1 Tax=Xylanimonas allomyrinae TaxID=2509459 RepID=UPI0013A5F7DB|nr:Ig-like domain-containing protein [Xylanimonas allomyrinae]
MFIEELAFADKIGSLSGFRASFVVRIPQDYIDGQTGELREVHGKKFVIGFARTPPLDVQRVELNYSNTLGSVVDDSWIMKRPMECAQYTIHKIVAVGDHFDLTVSVRGFVTVNVIASGATMNWYFGYGSGQEWLDNPATTHVAAYSPVDPNPAPWNTQGPIVSTIETAGAVEDLWHGGDFYWEASLDRGLNGLPSGVLPPRSLWVDVVSPAFGGMTEGPANSVVDSFWYAWVHRDGSLVQSINTRPTRLSGFQPHDNFTRPDGVMNVSGRLARGSAESTPGLTDKVGTDGSVDFRGAGGTGFYKLVVWPESRDPETVTNADATAQAPALSYTEEDLFSADGTMTDAAADASWLAAWVFYSEPPPPFIEAPADPWVERGVDGVTISGTGLPGHTITLKRGTGETITDVDAENLVILTDGSNACEPGECVVVGDDGRWSFTTTDALESGQYTVVAFQTVRTTANLVTSGPSNPRSGSPAAWGATFTVDNDEPAPPTMTCPAPPILNPASVSGAGVEAGATVRVYSGGDPRTLIGSAVVGENGSWSYTFDPPLSDGTYTVAVTATDAVGNESNLSAPCELLFSATVLVTGAKEIAPMETPPLGVPAPDLTNWEIIATPEDGQPVVISGGGASLQREATYTIAERLRTDPQPDDAAARYTQRGIVCTDANGTALPAGIFDPDAATITVGRAADVAAPIGCAVTNQTAHTALVTVGLSGETVNPPPGWSLTSSESGGFRAVSLDHTTPVNAARPGEHDLTARVPAGLAVERIEMLDTSTVSCQAHITSPADASENCWLTVTGAVTVEQGKPHGYRIVAGFHDVPALPITGGLGGWAFTASGAGVLLAAAGAALWRWLAITRPRRSREVMY